MTTSTWEQRSTEAVFALTQLCALAKVDKDDPLARANHQALLDFIADTKTLEGRAMGRDKRLGKLTELLTSTANAFKGDPGENTPHGWHDLPELATAATRELAAIRKAAGAFSMWWAMLQAQEELAEQPIPDSATILHFMGSGASTMVTAKQLRDMMTAIYGQTTKESDHD